MARIFASDFIPKFQQSRVAISDNPWSNREGMLRRCAVCRVCLSCGRSLPRNQPVAFVIRPPEAIQQCCEDPPYHPVCANHIARNAPSFLIYRWHSVGFMSPYLLGVWQTYNWRLDDKGPALLFRFGLPQQIIWYENGERISVDRADAMLEKLLHRMEATDDLTKQERRRLRSASVLLHELRHWEVMQ